MLYRDFGKSAASGPLREAEALAPAAGVVAGTKGLAVAWEGGRPPFVVSLENAGDGHILQRARTVHRYLWLPGWQPPASDFVLVVQDSSGATFRRTLRILPPAPVPDEGIAQAIQLYEAAPDYRLEALRRLAARAEAGDEVADQAIGLIRVSRGPP